jgi:DNA-binding NtrC family response regulator
MNKILVIDDEMSIRESFTLILEGKYKVVTAASGEGGLKFATDQKIDLAFLDIRMPGLNGLETLARIKKIDPTIEVIMVTAVNDVQKASEAIKLGARDYIIKPFDVEAVLKMAENILRRKALMREGTNLQKVVQKKTPELIGHNDQIVKINNFIENLPAKNIRVLILGETGTEKEVVARLIHEKSHRAAAPFIAFNLSAQMTAKEIALKLFGQGKGSTVVDLEKNSGLIDEAREGTVFINNIEYLPIDLLKNFSDNLGLIAGCSLANFAEQSKELLAYFADTKIELPPLRNRQTDLGLLINYHLEKLGEKHGLEIKPLAPSIEEIFSRYDWPGNTVELIATLERIVLKLATNTIELADLPIDLVLNQPGSPGRDYLSHFEKEYINNIYSFAGKNKEKASAILGINPSLIEAKL